MASLPRIGETIGWCLRVDPKRGQVAGSMKLQQKLSLSRAEEWIEEGNFFEGPATLRSKSFPTGPILVGDNGPYTDGDPVTLSDTEGLLSVKLKSSKYRPVFEGGRREVTIIAKFTSADGVRMCEDSIAVVWKR